MIPCSVCGNDSGAYWVAGYIPAPDSQKMGLCAIHDTPENRRAIRVTWLRAMQERIALATQNDAYFAARGAFSMLTIHFTAGGSLSVPCLTADVTEHNTLKVIAPDGAISFFPMQHVRRYDLTPLRQPPVNI